MELYYTIYAILLLCLGFELSGNASIKRSVMVFWVIFFTAFSGFRWETGGDWDQYYDHFLHSDWSNIFSYDRNGDGQTLLEPGFVFINALLKSLFGKFYVYNLVITLFIECVYYKFSLHFSPQRPLIPFIFINMSVLFPVRAGLSLGVVYLAFLFIHRRELKNFLLTMVVASSIHTQSLVLLPLYWLGYVKLSNNMYRILYVVLAVFAYIIRDYLIAAMLMMDGDISEKFVLYTEFESEGATGVNYPMWCMYFIFLNIFLYVKDKQGDKSDWQFILINGFMVFMLVFFLFQDGMGDLVRLSGVYLPCVYILFANSANYFLDNKSGMVNIYAIGFLLVYLIYKWSKICDSYYFPIVNVPYQSIFS